MDVCLYVCVRVHMCMFLLSFLFDSWFSHSLILRWHLATSPSDVGGASVPSGFVRVSFSLPSPRSFCDMLFKDTWTRTTRRTCTSWRMRSSLVGRSWLSGADERGRARAPRRARATRPPDSFELLQEVRALEVLRHRVVQPRDHLVDGLLPALLGVLAALDRFEKLFQRLLHNVPEVAGYLKVPHHR